MKNLPSARSVIIGTGITLVLLLFIYSYPRLIIGWLGEENPWTSYLYLYGFGLVFFLIGIFIIFRFKACQLGRGHDTFWFGILIAGFVFFATLHAVWILASLHMPYLGGQ